MTCLVACSVRIIISFPAAGFSNTDRSSVGASQTRVPTALGTTQQRSPSRKPGILLGAGSRRGREEAEVQVGDAPSPPLRSCPGSSGPSPPFRGRARQRTVRLQQINGSCGRSGTRGCRTKEPEERLNLQNLAGARRDPRPSSAKPDAAQPDLEEHKGPPRFGCFNQQRQEPPQPGTGARGRAGV